MYDGDVSGKGREKSLEVEPGDEEVDASGPTQPQPYEQDAAPDSNPQWPTDGKWWEGGKFINPGEIFQARRLETPQDRQVRSLGGKRSRTRTTRKRGRYSGFESSPRDASDLAFDATLRAAAPFQQPGRTTGVPLRSLRRRPRGQRTGTPPQTRGLPEEGAGTPGS